MRSISSTYLVHVSLHLSLSLFSGLSSGHRALLGTHSPSGTIFRRRRFHTMIACVECECYWSVHAEERV